MTNKIDISKVLRAHGRELGIRYVVTTTKVGNGYTNREAAMLRNSLMKK